MLDGTFWEVVVLLWKYPLTFLCLLVIWPLILKFRCFVICLFYGQKVIISVLLAFRFILFALSQWHIKEMSWLTCLFLRKSSVYSKFGSFIRVLRIQWRVTFSLVICCSRLWLWEGHFIFFKLAHVNLIVYPLLHL